MVKKNKIRLSVLALILLSLIGFFPKTIIVAESSKYYEEQINKLKDETAARNTLIEEAKKKQLEYKSIVEEKKTEALTLKSQKEEITAKILEAKFDIIETENVIERTKIEIKTLDLEILQNQLDIEDSKEKISDIIKIMYKNDSKNILEAFLLYNSLSEFLDQIKYTEYVQNGLAGLLDDYESQKVGLKTRKEALKLKTEELESQKIALENKKDDLMADQSRLSLLIEETQNQEVKFSAMMKNAIAEQNAMKAEIAEIASELQSVNSKFKTAKQREEMEAKLLEMGGKISNNSLSWPVPFNVITTYFYDPDYPYRKVIGEHAAVDVRAKQGTIIRAPAAGYVAKVKDGGKKGYSYIMLMHTNNVATVYGHVSSFAVKEDQYVSEGQIIGYSGGAPGTKGAGPFTTGAHLHFEVRVGGTPVNPLEYLKFGQ